MGIVGKLWEHVTPMFMPTFTEHIWKNDVNHDGPWEFGHQMSVVLFSQCDTKDAKLKDTSLGSINFPLCWVDVAGNPGHGKCKTSSVELVDHSSLR